ncbi:MAG: hypothetical protein B6244_08910 [Candidatus Cloacimonetes bacterium 4572_55]|nr:MAG: hypothetical protein B6244_08910 [Candidatus Cloacimonetes bacterium 4572_55]
MTDIHKRLDHIEGELRRLGVSTLPHFHYKSDANFFGMPLVNIEIGGVQSSLKVTRGVLAVGNVAMGVVAIGAVSLGLLSIGGIAAGLVAIGSKRFELRDAIQNRLDMLEDPPREEDLYETRGSLHYGSDIEYMTPC